MNAIRPKMPRWWKAFWPQVPLALFLIAAGTVNVLSGFNAQDFAFLTSQALPQFSSQISLGVLGSGAQIVFGAGLVFTGVGLFWRVRVAWTFAVLLLLITLAINLVKGHVGGALLLPAAVLVALLALQHHFTRRTVIGSSLVSLVGVFSVIAYGTLGMYLIGDQFEPPIDSLMSSLYFLVETLSTTGYGDYHPITPFAQGFMITVWVVGLGVFGTAIVSVVGPLFGRHLNRFLSPGGARRMEKDHVILVGSGIIAGNTAHELARRHMSFVQVLGDDEDASAPMPDHPVIVGDTSDDKTLYKAGIEKARMLIAAEDDDGENAFISLAAKNINPALNVLIVASSQRAIKRLKLARADMVFAPADVGSRLLANLVEGEDLPEQFGDLLERNSPR